MEVSCSRGGFRSQLVKILRRLRGLRPGLRPGKCARGVKSGVRSGGESQCASTTTIDEVHDKMALYAPMPQGFSFAKLLITMVGLWISVLLHGRVHFAGRVALRRAERTSGDIMWYEMYCGGVLPRNSLNSIAAASAIKGVFWRGVRRTILGVYA